MIRGLCKQLSVLSLLTILLPVEAHEIRPGYLEIIETTPNTYGITWKAPIRLDRPLAVEPRFPIDCETSSRSIHANERTALINKASVSCKMPLQSRRIYLAGLDATLTDVLVRFQPADGAMQALRATPDMPMVEVAENATRQSVAHTYFVLGVEHILFGIDHLLFVLALVLLITGARRLIETITAFTLAHSITLVFSSLGWISLASAPVEATIALSIVFLANELANKSADATRLSEKRPWLVALAFGLLHGFGFAGALAEIGLPKGEMPVALFTFNLGVEAGQLAFLASILLLLNILGRLHLRQRVDLFASYAIGTTASVWLIARIV